MHLRVIKADAIEGTLRQVDAKKGRVAAQPFECLFVRPSRDALKLVKSSRAQHHHCQAQLKLFAGKRVPQEGGGKVGERPLPEEISGDMGGLVLLPCIDQACDITR